MKNHCLVFLAVVVSLLCSVICQCGSLQDGFVKPPESAAPWVYWFWANGNITKEGITADLEAMKRVGIGGVLIMEVDQGAPYGPVDFMSDQWRELFKHVDSEANRLGLQVNMNNDAGWNGSGGPWIKPENSMQKVVWTEITLQGSQHYDAAIAQPETVAGFYKDIAVLAFPSVGGYRIDNIHFKAGYWTHGGAPMNTGEPTSDDIISEGAIVDITSNMASDGRLVWDVPDGNWTVMRIGYTSTGVTNSPAPATGVGLECDKLSRNGIEAAFAGMIGKLADDVAPGGGAGLVAAHIDSWENGAQNWTADMREEFYDRCGYDITPFLPVMSGRVYGSLEISERFLWDLRKTISNMLVDNYAAHMRELANSRNMRFTVEAYGAPCDSIPYAGASDEPMGEFWTPTGAIETCKSMACAAHIYGKNVVGAEAFTSGDTEKWREHPAVIKSTGDRAFCEGINRFVFHRYAMQPWVGNFAPGMTMGPWGQHYERTQTWWEISRGWHDYLSRCQFMLRQGLFVADICYVLPESSPQGPHGHDRSGYDWDECTSKEVVERMSVKNGRIMLPDGMSYRVLVLSDSHMMSLPLLRKVKELVNAGAVVVGRKPLRSPSLVGYPLCDKEVKQIAEEVWGDCDGRKIKERRFGKGKIVCGVGPEDYLANSGIVPDFRSGLPLRFIHRGIDGGDIYFVANPRHYALTTTAHFRVSGKTPELWWPDTGRIEYASMYDEKDGVTNVVLPLGPSDSVFVVFKEAAKVDSVVEVTRAGERLFGTSAIPPIKVTIDKAIYGVPGDTVRSRDVRKKVQRRVDGGEYSFPALVMADGDDPAQGVLKTLEVDYIIDGKKYSVKAVDPETLYIGDEAVKIQVEKAVYGILDDPKRTRDVTARVQKMADSGIGSFVVAKMASDGDPAFLVVKTLKIDYIMDGKKVSVSGVDPEIINFSPPKKQARPIAEVRRSDNGKVYIEMRKPGVYNIKTASGKTKRIDIKSVPAPVIINGPWKLFFPPNWGAPTMVKLDKLMSWTMHPQNGVKYFSGTATYVTTFNVPQTAFDKNQVLYLNLGDVQVMAQVKLNGKSLGVMWKPPFAARVDDFLKPGQNVLEVKVTNLWPNRMIGDEQLSEDSDRHPNGTLKSWPQWVKDGKSSPAGRYTFTTWRLWKKDDMPLSSGLIGPVSIEIIPEIAL